MIPPKRLFIVITVYVSYYFLSPMTYNKSLLSLDMLFYLDLFFFAKCSHTVVCFLHPDSICLLLCILDVL